MEIQLVVILDSQGYGSGIEDCECRGKAYLGGKLIAESDTYGIANAMEKLGDILQRQLAG